MTPARRMQLNGLIAMGIVQETPKVFRALDRLVDIRKASKCLRIYSQEHGLDNTRICFHSGDESPVQQMLIFHSQKYIVPVHMHPKKDEWLTVISGSCKLNEYSVEDDMTTLESTIGLNADKMVKIERNKWHNLVFIEDTTFLEVSSGPFDIGSTVRKAVDI